VRLCARSFVRKEANLCSSQSRHNLAVNPGQNATRLPASEPIDEAHLTFPADFFDLTELAFVGAL
jgi:hypothetical protein